MVVKLDSVKSGDIYTTKRGGPVEVLEYHHNRKVVVRFMDFNKHTCSVTLQALRNGFVTNPYSRNLFGVGYIGVGPHKTVDSEGKMTKTYNAWKNMLERCYYKARKIMNPSYEDAKSCDEWHCFQNFANWYHNQNISDGLEWQLDKDLFGNGDKLYSPETCVLLPSRINVSIKNMKVDCSFILPEYSETNLPVGVSYHQKSKIFVSTAAIMNTGDKADIKYFKSPFDAFRWYKKNKEAVVKYLAEQHKEVISLEVYLRLINLQAIP